MKNKKDIFILIPIVLTIASIILNNFLGDLDEIWNYNFARNILEGKLPYKDFNMLQMPLLPIINAIILFIFGNQIIVMRFIAIVLCSAIIFLLYKIFRRLNINLEVSLILTLVIIYLFKNYFRIDYNFASLFVILIIIYNELKYSDKILKSNTRNDILIGVLAGIIILFKQTIGIVLCAVAIGYKLLIVRNRQEFKEYIKIVLLRIFGIFIPMLIFIIYITNMGIWKDFIDYTILGVKSFSNSISYINLIKKSSLIIMIMSILLPINTLIQFIYSNIKFRKTNVNIEKFILSSYSIGTFAMVFPISDEIHFLIATAPSMILLFYCLYDYLKNIINIKEKIFVKNFLKIFNIYLMISLSIISIITLVNYSKYCMENETYLEHFKYIRINAGLEKKINIVDKYINKNSKNVLIMDATAGVYMIPINRYNKDYDMLLKGNLGSKDEDGIIDNLKKMDNTVLLIMSDNKSRNWQNPEKVRQYIKCKWNKTGSIECFDIYEK